MSSRSPERQLEFLSYSFEQSGLEIGPPLEDTKPDMSGNKNQDSDNDAATKVTKTEQSGFLQLYSIQSSAEPTLRTLRFCRTRDKQLEVSDFGYPPTVCNVKGI